MDGDPPPNSQGQPVAADRTQIFIPRRTSGTQPGSCKDAKQPGQKSALRQRRFRAGKVFLYIFVPPGPVG